MEKFPWVCPEGTLSTPLPHPRGPFPTYIIREPIPGPRFPEPPVVVSISGLVHFKTRNSTQFLMIFMHSAIVTYFNKFHTHITLTILTLTKKNIIFSIHYQYTMGCYRNEQLYSFNIA
jgi:hypothetical protein